MGDINKLPKWAQSEIKRLGENVDHWMRKYHEAIGDAPKTPRSAILVDYNDTDLVLPDARILFPYQGIEMSVDSENRLTARAVGRNGFDAISIYPSVANAIYLRGVRYDASRSAQ